MKTYFRNFSLYIFVFIFSLIYIYLYVYFEFFILPNYPSHMNAMKSTFIYYFWII